MNFTLANYINAALSNALYDKLDDGSFAGRIPACKGYKNDCRTDLTISLCRNCLRCAAMS